MQTLKDRYFALDPKAQRGFLLVLGLAVLLTLAGIYFIPQALAADNLEDMVSNGIPLLVGLLSLTSAGLILSGRPLLGGLAVTVGLTLGAFGLVATVAQYGFLLAVIVFVCTSYVGNQIFSGRAASGFPLLGFFVSVVIFIADTYWPWTRRPADPFDFQVASYLVISILFIYGVSVLRQFHSFPMRNKLVLVFVIVTVIPVAAVAYYSNRTTTQILTQEANQSLLRSASQVASAVDTFIKVNKDELRTEAQNPVFRTLLSMPEVERRGSQAEAIALEILESLLRKDAVSIQSYALLDQEGINVADTTFESIGSNESAFGYFNTPLQTGLPYASPVMFLDTAGVLYFSAPVRNDSGETVGVLRARFDANILQVLMFRSGEVVFGELTTVLVDENNFLLAHSKQPELLLKPLVPLDEAKAAALKESGRLPNRPLAELDAGLPELAGGLANIATQPVFTAELDPFIVEDESKEIGGGVKLAGQPWSVAVFQPEAELLAPVDQQQRDIRLIGILAGGFAVLAGVVVSQFIANPITRLTGVAEQVARGELGVQAPVESQDEVGTLARTFNMMTGQLRELITTLEQRVAERTKALQTATEVSRRLSTILEQERLVREVVEQLQSAFGYYHAHIYLFDEDKQELVMAGGTGEAGRVMLGRGHRIPSGRGLVGRAAETKTVVLVPDVAQEESWLPNPLLPETKAEIAVPIAMGGEVLGVLDVQQNVVGGLSQQDADLLQAIANQVAIALQNAQAYTRAQRQAKREALVASLGQRIQRAGSIDEVLQVTVSELGKALSARRSYVEIRTPEADN